MSVETIIATTAAVCEILIFLGGLGTMLYQLGTFKATVAERLNHSGQEIHELKQSVTRIDEIVSTLREDRIRLNKIEEDVRELRQMLTNSRA